MRNTKITIPLSLLLLLTFAFLAKAEAEQINNAKINPTARELIDKYAETQNKIYKSFIMKFEATSVGNQSFTSIIEQGRRKGGIDTEIRYDGKRFYWKNNMWANCSPDVKMYIPRDDPRTKCELWDGNIYYNHSHEPLEMINELADKQCKTVLQRKLDI